MDVFHFPVSVVTVNPLQLAVNSLLQLAAVNIRGEMGGIKKESRG